MDSLPPPSVTPVDDAAAQLATATPSPDWIDILTWLGESRKTLAIAVACAIVLSVALAFVVPRTYTARAAMLPPPQQNQGASATLAALGALGGLSSLTGAKSPDEMYVGLLKSDSLIRALDTRLNLRAHYDASSFEALQKELPDHVKITAEKKSGLISVEVEDTDAQFAAELANAHIEELRQLLSRLAVTEAQQRRHFYEHQLLVTKENLIKADQNFQQMQERSGAIVIDKQAESILSGMAQTRARIAEREVQLRVLRQSATEANPDVQRLQAEIAGLRIELSRMEKHTPDHPSAVDLPAGQIPELVAHYIRARREVKFQEALLESLLKQFELARLDAAKEGPSLQWVDTALPPERPTKPSRALIVLASTLLCTLVTAGWITWQRYRLWQQHHDPMAAQAWQALRKAWGVKS